MTFTAWLNFRACLFGFRYVADQNPPRFEVFIGPFLFQWSKEER